jgi:small subunit ribosomal protein S7
VLDIILSGVLLIVLELQKGKTVVLNTALPKIKNNTSIFMSRKINSFKAHQILADPIYNSKIVALFINYIMKDGKKLLAQRMFYRIIEQLNNKLEGTSGLDIFLKAVENVSPLVELRSRRLGGTSVMIPTELKSSRSQMLAMKWIVKFARVRSEKGAVKKFVSEILDAFDNKGASIKKKSETYKIAEANRVFAYNPGKITE